MLYGIRLLAPAEKLAGAFKGLLRPLAHLDQALRAVGGDLLERLADTDPFHWDCGLELRAVGAAFAHGR